MSDLQISLIIIGIIIIVGVAIFNWVQQQRFRRKIESSLNHRHDDVLLDKSNDSGSHERIEPQLDNNYFINAPSQSTDITEKPADVFHQDDIISHNVEAQEPPAAESPTNNEEYDSLTNYVVIISAKTTIPDGQLNTLLHRKFDFHKPLTWFGKKETSGYWEEISTGTITENTNFTNLKGCLLLADRSGPIKEIDLSKFRDTVQDFAAQINASAECPDIVSSHEKAILLDKFCADVDVMIGINIISKDDGAFVGTKIRALAEASGFRLEPDGLFKYRDENSQVLFTLTNYESESFMPDNMKTLTTHGVTFLLDVPRVANGEKIFDQMTHLAKIFSNTLGGIMVDDNRVPLSENGLSRSKQQLASIQTTMKENNIIAGSETALRLFN